MGITSTQFRMAVKTGKRVKAKIEKSIFEPVEVNSDRTATFIFSSNIQDRECDVIDPNGIDFANFMKNPVILWAHDQAQFPIAKCISLAVIGSKLVGKIKFHPGDMPISGPVAEEAYRQLQLGVLGVSIGFAPTEYDLNDLGGVDYTKIELLETSIVSVPCNPEALLVDLSKPEEDTKEDDEETEGMDEEEIEGSATIPDKKEVAPTKVKSPYNEALKLYFEYLD